MWIFSRESRCRVTSDRWDFVWKKKTVLRSSNVNIISFLPFFYKINEGDLPLMYSCVPVLWLLLCDPCHSLEGQGSHNNSQKTTKSIIKITPPSFLRTSLKNFPRSLSRACISRYVLYIEISIALLFTKFFKFLPLTFSTLYILYWICRFLGYEKVVKF